MLIVMSAYSFFYLNKHQIEIFSTEGLLPCSVLGGDNQWQLHGSFGAACEEREQACCRNCYYGVRYALFYHFHLLLYRK